ncbi:MAG: M48 family metalloprotease [Ottowia sp.]|nr:M48 family metalloprotease [Ottowia sp.]
MTPTKFAALALASVLAFGALPAAAQHQHAPLPSLGDAGLMGSAEERRLGDEIARSVYRDPDWLDDAILSEYVDGIWQRLLAAARQRGELNAEMAERYAWRVLIWRDNTINAFALPGGYFGLHTGLLGLVASRDELASVLAHELTHVTQRHIARMIGQEARQTPLMLAAMVLGALAAGSNAQAGAAIMAGGQAALIQQQLNYSRAMESEADRIGWGVLTGAGYSPRGAAVMFERLQRASGFNDNGEWPYLRSHPLTVQRIGEAQQRQQAVHAPALAPDVEALMMAARARVLGKPGMDALRTWAGAPQQGGFDKLPAPERVAALYAAALAQRELRDVKGALHTAERLTQEAKGQGAAAARQAALLHAELLLADKQPTAALRAIREMPAAPKGKESGLPQAASQQGRAALLLRAAARARLGDAKFNADSAAELRDWLALRPWDGGAWQALATADAAQGHTLQALRAEGEVFMARLDWEGAIDRFRAAQQRSRDAKDPAERIEASIIDTRLAAAREAQRRQQEEGRKKN